jgi:hypothetical protein
MGPALEAKEPAMALEFDDTARALLRRRRGHGLSILFVNGYGLGVEGLSVEWCRSAGAEHDPGLTFLGTYDGVPIYVHRRLAAYLRWHPLRLRAGGHAWWQGLSVEGDGEVLRALAFWESTHPQLCGRTREAGMAS